MGHFWQNGIFATRPNIRVFLTFSENLLILNYQTKNKGKELKMTTRMTFDEYDTIIVTYENNEFNTFSFVDNMDGRIKPIQA